MILEPVAIPAPKTSSGRPKEPNPFIDGEFAAAFKALPVDGTPGTPGAALALEIPGLLDMKANKEFGKVSRQLRDAGYALEPKRSVRQIHEQVLGADKKPSVRITFYLITLIERKRKTAEMLTDNEAAELERSENAIPEVNDDNDGDPAPVTPAPVAKGRSRSAAK